MKKGFTLIEFIFVMIILFILSAVAIPKLVKAKQESNTQNQEIQNTTQGSNT